MNLTQAISPTPNRFRRLILFLNILTGFVIILTFLATYFKIRSSEGTLALHYNVIIGVDSLGNKYGLLQLPGIALGIATVNWLLSRFIQTRDQFLSLLAVFVSFVAALFLFFSVLFLYFVN